MSAQDILTRYENLADLAESIRLRREAERERVMASVKAELDAIDAELGPVLQGAQEAADAALAELKGAVTLECATVKGNRLMAVYNKPRTTWDTKALEGYAAAHPEIERFKKVGDPTVTIRSK